MLAMSLIISGALLQQPPKLKSFHDKDMDISFQYPRTWNLKRERYWTVINYRTSTGHNVRIQFLPTYFRQTKETWQQLQIDVAKGRGETVAKQSEEEILGVPLLLTRVNHQENGVSSSVWTGLIYSKTEQKLNFRVESDTADADETEQDWRNVLLSLRTGEAPKPEDPNSKIDPKKPKEDDDVVPDGPPVKWTSKTGHAAKPVRAPQRIKLGDTGFLAYAPAGWSYDKNQLTATGLKGTITIKAGVYNSEQIEGAVLGVGAQQLQKISVIHKREETLLGKNKAGYSVRRIVRLVKTVDGKEEAMLLFGGQFDVFGWIVTYEGSSVDEKSDRVFVDSLVNSLSVESGS